MPKTTTVEVQHLEDGDAFITIPPQMLKHLGWDESTDLNVEITVDNKVILTKAKK